MNEEIKVTIQSENLVLDPDKNLFHPPLGSFQKELEALINHHSIEGGSNSPDFILAEYLRQCLDTFDIVVRARDKFYR